MENLFISVSIFSLDTPGELQINLLGDRCTAHGIEQERCALGEGVIPLSAIVRNLLDAGYQGDFDVELFGQDIELSNYEDLLVTSKQTFDQLFAPASRP